MTRGAKVDWNNMHAVGSDLPGANWAYPEASYERRREIELQHFVTERGFAISDGVIWRVPPKPYGISYRSIIPRKGECKNLLSPICVSATHVAHGSIRMEPVFMALSQSAAIAAGAALDQQVSVQDVDYAVLRTRLLAAKQILQP